MRADFSLAVSQRPKRRSRRDCPFFLRKPTIPLNRLVASIALFVVAMIAMTTAHAQTASDSTTMAVQVPGLVSINATNDLVRIDHSQTNANQSFDWQDWQVTCNNRLGAIVTFETDQAFTHTTNPTSKRDARLLLVPGGAQGWRITRNLDRTNYQRGDEVAVVSAESNSPRAGQFRLRVSYIEEDFNDTLLGIYELTVTGTIVAK
jgi:hypothetical protein